jgi:hypothetical protein
MASTDYGTGVILCNDPFLIKRWEFTAGTDATALTHGEDRSPDIAFVSCSDVTNPTSVDGIDRKTSATTLTCDFTAAETYVLTCIWVSQGTGGIS